jgi:hypothetical protein
LLLGGLIGTARAGLQLPRLHCRNAALSSS